MNNTNNTARAESIAAFLADAKEGVKMYEALLNKQRETDPKGYNPYKTKLERWKQHVAALEAQ